MFVSQDGQLCCNYDFHCSFNMDDQQHYSNSHHELNVDSMPGATKSSNDTSFTKTTLSSVSAFTAHVAKQQQGLVSTLTDYKISVSLETGDEKRTTMSMAALTPAQKIVVDIYNEDAYTILKHTPQRQGTTASRNLEANLVPPFLEGKETQTTGTQDTKVLKLIPLEIQLKFKRNLEILIFLIYFITLISN